MTQWKRLGFYLLLNVIVSACTMLGVLWIWDRTHKEEPVPDLAQVNPLETSPTITPFIQPATATPTPEPTKHLETYEVQFGETLGEIALRYEVSVEELMEINDIEDPKQLGAGTILFIPVPTPEVTPTPKQNQFSVPPPTIIPPEGEGAVTIERVVGAGVLQDEFVLLKASGEKEVNLNGWSLTDDDGNRYAFPQMTLFPGGAVAVHTKSGNSTVVDLYWGMDRPVWDAQDIAVLYDANGDVRSTYRLP